jgi:hypothetical protein
VQFGAFIGAMNFIYRLGLCGLRRIRDCDDNYNRLISGALAGSLAIGVRSLVWQSFVSRSFKRYSMYFFIILFESTSQLDHPDRLSTLASYAFVRALDEGQRWGHRAGVVVVHPTPPADVLSIVIYLGSCIIFAKILFLPLPGSVVRRYVGLCHRPDAHHVCVSI